VNVKSHRRRITKAWGRDIAPREVQVKSFVAFRNIPARPYLNPGFDAVQADLQRLLESMLPAAFAEIATIRKIE